jgi:hypothetical protein
LALLAGAVILGYQHFYPHATTAKTIDKSLRLSWRMPPLALLAAPKLPLGSRIGLTVLRSYLLVAMIMVIFRIYQLAVGHK